MLIEELQTVSSEILLEHLTNQIDNGDKSYYPKNPWGKRIANIFASEFKALIGEHQLNLQAVPVTTPEVLELADRVLKTDPRTTKAINGVPAALSGINPFSKERSAMIMLVVGDIPQASGQTKKELVGIRSLTYASEQDIAESYGFNWDEHGYLTPKSYQDLVPENHRVLMRGWTTLVVEAGGVSLRSNGIGGKLDQATHAAALALKEFSPNTLIMGEQMGLLPAAINQKFSEYVLGSSEKIGMQQIKFPLYEILGFNDPEVAIKEVNTTLSGNNQAEIAALNEKFKFLGVNPYWLREVIKSEFSIAGLLGRGNPNAEKMKKSAQEMGAVVVPNMMSCKSAGRQLTSGPVYIGEIKNTL